MAEKVQKYILMSDRLGEHIEKGWIASKNVPSTQLLRGEIFEALPESDQPEDPDKIALIPMYISDAKIKLECPTLDVVKLSDSEADLLAAVSSLEERFWICRERNRLALAKKLVVGSTVLVKLENNVKEYKGVIWYKGPLPTYKGIMFGVELLDKEAEGQGTSDGTFRNKKYFACPEDCGIFVALDKIRPHQDTAKSPKKEPGLTSKIRDYLTLSSRKDYYTHNKLVAQDHQLKIDQRVVVYINDDHPCRGTVRYISEKYDSNGDRPIGIALDKRMGIGTGVFQGKQRFVCKRDHAVFYPVSMVIPEEYFDASNSSTVRSSSDRLAKSDGLSGLLGYEVNARKPGSTSLQTPFSILDPENPFISNIPSNPHIINNKPVANMERIPVQAQFNVGGSTLTKYCDLVQPGGAGELKFPTDTEMRDPQSSVQVFANDDVKSRVSGLKVGSMVEVLMEGKGIVYGVIRWIGQLPELPGKTVAGLELEVEQVACSDGVFGGQRYFTCPPGRGFFINLQNCRRDSRFQGDSPGAAKYSRKEREAHEETKRRLQSSEQRAQQLEKYLSQERQASEETERRLQGSEQISQQLETSLSQLRQAYEETERRLQSSEKRSQELETSLSQVRQAYEETERRLQGSEERSQQLETSLSQERHAHEESKRHLQISEQRSGRLEASLLEESQRSNELETTLATVRQALEECRNSKNIAERDWVLFRSDIVLSEHIIGTGAWGTVMEGTFRGSKVAVKEIHRLILSRHNRRLFEREMSMASRCRHPCLLQFIGATLDDESPLFVTELLDTSLRAVLHDRALQPTEIKTIALDVAKGLNYLHLNQPAPIIHRDISSANVLLWKRDTGWRAKVSDYGTTNVLQQSMTAGPGAVIYSAPEAQTSRQTPKVDVYSYGVLLCEMNVREMPDVQHREEQVAMVTNNFFRNLIRRCLQQKPEERPSMAEIIGELESSP